MKVLHLVPSIPPPEFVKKDLHYSKQIADIDTTIMKVNRRGGWKRLPVELFKMGAKALRILKINPTVIHCHFISTVIPAVLSGIPAVVTIHESYDWYPFWWRPIIKIAARHCEIAYISEHNRNLWLPTLGKGGSVIYHAIDTDIFDPDKYNAKAHQMLLDELDTGYIIMLMGPFHPTRGYHLAIKACKKLRKQGLDLGIVFKGYGGKDWYRDNLIELADELEVPMKMVIERLSDNELAQLYAISDVFVRPGVAEGFGIAVLEAQGCGTPVVVSNCASLKEVFKDSSLRFEPMNQNSLARNIKKALMEEDIRSDLINSGLENAKQMTWRKKIGNYMSAYARAMDAHEE